MPSARLSLLLECLCAGDGPYFNTRRADPGLLEDPRDSRPLRRTNFVLLHGGWPHTQVTQAMRDKPNTSTDFLARTFYLSLQALSQVLRSWLEWHPEKTMASRARRALAIALTGMMQSGDVTRDRAVEVVRGVLRDHAVKRYSPGTAPR